MRRFSSRPGTFTAYYLLAAALPLSLSACGGGGGSGSSPPPANRAPVSNAGVDQTVFEGATVNLSGSGSDADNDPLTYAWTQTAGQGVTIDNDTSASANFLAPDVAAGSPETLTFQLTVSDGEDDNSDTVAITIEENVPPSADAGADRNVIENSVVTLDGTGSSDANSIDTLTYAWTQVGGNPVTLNDADTAEPSFTAPDQAPGASETVDFELVVSDGVHDASDTVTITVEDGQAMVAISGKVEYEFVPPGFNCNGLNFLATAANPIRGATVELLDATSGNVIDATRSDAAGDYAFADVDALRDVRLRVRAEIKSPGTPNLDVDVRDNVDTSGSPPRLEDRPLYVLESADFNTGGADITDKDLTATTGWDPVSSSYTGPRAAAPFAILDAIYSGIELVLSADPNAVFAPLDAFWSVNNRVAPGAVDFDSGDVGTFYTSNPDGGLSNPSMFLLGDASGDTDEFDRHVVVHEWGHFFEDNFSRSDSIGGPHSLGESLDARLAFGEGWGYAISAIALGDPLICDTGTPGTTEGFGVDAESDSFGIQGWFNEVSIITFLYDLFDTDNDGTDTDSIGFQPIFDTMTGPQFSTDAFTSVFSFATELRTMLDAQRQAFLDSQLTRENINPAGLDIWASTETNDAGGAEDVLPLYTDLPTDGTPITICTNSRFEGQSGNPPETERDGNQLAEMRYLRIAVTVPGSYNVRIDTLPTTPPLPPDDPGNPSDQSDPDMYLFRSGSYVTEGTSGEANFEEFDTPVLSAGTYVAELGEFRFFDPDTPSGFPDQVCFDVRMAL